MTRNILLVKLSSMGDVVHSFPALSEAASLGYRFDWVVEEAFADLAAQHPAVDRVIPFALRRWRRQLSTGVAELVRFVQDLREHQYDEVLDAQGLAKSAFITRASGAGIRMGLDRSSARESIASAFYNKPVTVGWELHAIDRLRTLFASALGYDIDLGAPVMVELDASMVHASPEPGATLLVHGTTWPSKEVPEVLWQALIANLCAAGHRLEILSGGGQEYERALRLAAQIPNARALEPGSLMSAFDRIRTARLVIGVDSGLTHLAAVLGRPVIGLYGSTSDRRTGVRGRFAANLASSFGCAPCLQRECNYTGPAQLLAGKPVKPACYAELAPERIVAAATALLERNAG